MIFLLLGYMWLFIHRPFEVWPVLGTLRIEFLYMLLTTVFWLFSSKKQFRLDPLHIAFFLFAFAVLLSVLLSPWGDACLFTLDNYSKFFVFYLFLITVVHSEKALQRVTFCFLLVMFVYMSHSLLEYANGRHVARMGIKRMVGVDSSYGDPNAFGSSIVLALVFVPCAWASRPTLPFRLFFVSFITLAGLCISLTGSRGAFLCLLVWAIIAIARSRWRWQLAAFAVVASPILWFALPANLQNRFETIIHPEVGPVNAQKSADARLDGLITGFQLFREYPFSGIGPGAWRPATGRKLEAHNLYGQLFGEMGFLGAMAFLGILVAFLLNIRSIRHYYLQHPEYTGDYIHELSNAVCISLFLLLLQGTFGHNLFRYQWVWFGAFLAIARQCLLNRPLHPASVHLVIRNRCIPSCSYFPSAG